MNWTVIYDRDGELSEPETVTASGLTGAMAQALKSANGRAVHSVNLIPDLSDQVLTPTADPLVQAAPNGTLYRLTVTNTGASKWVKIPVT